MLWDAALILLGQASILVGQVCLRRWRNRDAVEVAGRAAAARILDLFERIRGLCFQEPLPIDEIRATIYLVYRESLLLPHEELRSAIGVLAEGARHPVPGWEVEVPMPKSIGAWLDATARDLLGPYLRGEWTRRTLPDDLERLSRRNRQIEELHWGRKS